MAALSIPIVVAEGKKISPNLNLVRLAGRFEWTLDVGDARKTMVVPTDKIRGLKLDQWLVYARALVEGKPVGEIQPTAPSKPAPAAEKDYGPMPSFMLISNAQKPIPFDPDPEVQGYRDGTRGFTACPYSLKPQVDAWNRGHDRAFAEGKADKPRFGTVRSSRR